MRQDGGSSIRETSLLFLNLWHLRYCFRTLAFRFILTSLPAEDQLRPCKSLRDRSTQSRFSWYTPFLFRTAVSINCRARVLPIGGLSCIQAFHTSQDVWGTQYMSPPTPKTWGPDSGVIYIVWGMHPQLQQALEVSRTHPQDV